MNSHPKPRYSSLRPRKKVFRPGGEYIFDCLGRHYELPGKFVQDPLSPSDDGLRWIAAPESKPIIRRLVCELANKQCEVQESKHCWKWAPVDRGHPHHTIHKKMGGAFTDDRIFLKIGGETVQIRVWSCPNCHQKHHGDLQFGIRRVA
jgi:hypothetical protein